MYIDLKWSNVNSGAMKTNIYRGLTALDKANLGTPIVTLTNNETTYRDSNVTAGTTYNYVIEFEANGNKVSTRNFTATANYVRGHGLSTVSLGNENYGFMDYVSVGRTVGVLSAAGIVTTGTTDIAFGPGLKFSYNNKVYYCVLLTGNQVGSTLSTISPLLNNDAGIPISVEGFNYLLRLCKVLGPTWDGTTKVTTTTDLDDFYIKFVLPQLAYLANWPGESLGKLNNLTATNVMIGRETVSGTVAGRVGRNATVLWTATTTTMAATWYLPFILELVE